MQTAKINLTQQETTATIQPVVNGNTLSMLVSFRNQNTGELEGTTEAFPYAVKNLVPAYIQKTLASGTPQEREHLHQQILTFFQENQDRIAIQELFANLHSIAQGQPANLNPTAEATLILMNSITP